MLINHFHVMPPGFMDKNRPEIGTIEHIRRLMDRLGIDRGVLFAPFRFVFGGDANSGYRHSNTWLSELAGSDPRFLSFITVNPLDPECLSILTEFADRGFVGIKFHPPVVRARIDDPALEPFYAKAAELKLPILVHTGVHGWRLDYYRPMLLDKVAQDHPTLKIIVEHMGGFELFEEALAVVKNNPNCYAGVTSVVHTRSQGEWQPFFPHLERLLLRGDKWAVGPDRIIYGADFPYNSDGDIERDLQMISSWKLAPSERDAILGNNLHRILASR